MGNICSCCGLCGVEQVDDSYEGRLGNVERRVLDIEQHMFLSKSLDKSIDAINGRDPPNCKKYKEGENRVFFHSNPIHCPETSNKSYERSERSELTKPLYPNQDAAYAMAWSK
jgi:hypothetical protein